MRRAPAFRATRVPEGTGASRHGDRQVFQVPALWPGITWGRNALCSCSWAYRDGVAQVKVRSGACTVHIGGREPGPEPVAATAPEYELPPPAEPPDAALLAACQAGTVTREIYEESVRQWQAARQAGVLAAVLVPRIAELAELLLEPALRPAVTYCPCGREHDLVDAMGRRRCGVCRRRQSREATTRYRGRKRAAARAAA